MTRSDSFVYIIASFISCDVDADPWGFELGVPFWRLFLAFYMHDLLYYLLSKWNPVYS